VELDDKLSGMFKVCMVGFRCAFPLQPANKQNEYLPFIKNGKTKEGPLLLSKKLIASWCFGSIERLLCEGE
jgi:hypothetical protein